MPILVPIRNPCHDGHHALQPRESIDSLSGVGQIQVSVQVQRQVNLAMAHQFLGHLRHHARAGQHRPEGVPQRVDVRRSATDSEFRQSSCDGHRADHFPSPAERTFSSRSSTCPPAEAEGQGVKGALRFRRSHKPRANRSRRTGWVWTSVVAGRDPDFSSHMPADGCGHQVASCVTVPATDQKHPGKYEGISSFRLPVSPLCRRCLLRPIPRRDERRRIGSAAGEHQQYSIGRCQGGILDDGAAFAAAAEESQVVLVMKVSNACPVGQAVVASDDPQERNE